MQHGSIIRAERRHGPDVWEFRWRESGADGERKLRRMVLGSVEQLADETAARQAIATLRLQLNRGDAWLSTSNDWSTWGRNRQATKGTSMRAHLLMRLAGAY